jgi:hypothetical protein
MHLQLLAGKAVHLNTFAQEYGVSPESALYTLHILERCHIPIVRVARGKYMLLSAAERLYDAWSLEE